MKISTKHTYKQFSEMTTKKSLKLNMSNGSVLLLSASTSSIVIAVLVAMQMAGAIALSTVNDDQRQQHQRVSRSLSDFDDMLNAHSGSDNFGNVETIGEFGNLDGLTHDHHYQPQHFDELHADIFEKPGNGYPDGEYLQGEVHSPEFSSPLFLHRDHRVEDNDEDGSENLDFLGRFLSMFSMYTTLFEFPSFLNSRLSLTKRLVSKPVKIPKKYYNESANIIYDVRPIEHIGGSGPGVSGGGEGGNVAIRPVAEIIDTFKDKLKAIYPGTLWCGDGNQARSEYEVGIFRNTDICCRMHDKCPSSIPAGHTYKNLRNGGLFTRSHCDCDQEFYRCLKKANSIVSNKIGYTYFNILRPQCYRREHPIIGCRKWTSKKCYVYVINNEQPTMWQWFDNKMY